MNYIKIYSKLIDRAKGRNLISYTENHHIIPKCMGGDNSPENLVALTPEEHYVAHQLLVKIYPENYALAKAAAMMIPNRPSNKMYGWIRRRFSIAKSVEQSGAGNSRFGTKWIYHPTFGSKTVDQDLIVEYIEQGWILGRVLKYCNTKKSKVYINEEKKNNDTRTHREYYEIYSKYGFEKFVEITGYKYSKQNLVQRFAKLLPEFIPQNGKKR